MKEVKSTTVPPPQSSAPFSHPSPKHVQVLQPAKSQYQPQHVPSPPPPTHPSPPTHPNPPIQNVSPAHNGMKKVYRHAHYTDTPIIVPAFIMTTYGEFVNVIIFGCTCIMIKVVHVHVNIG